MTFELLEPANPRWLACVTAWESDVYHLPEYGVATRQDRVDVRAALVTRDGRSLLLPLMIREIEADAGLVDAISPYGYPGPILSPMSRHDRSSFAGEATPELIDGLASAGIVSAFVRMHPFVGLRPGEIPGVGTIVHHGETVLIDLARTVDELWTQTRKSHRHEINRSRKQGHRAYLDDRWEHFECFVDIYAETMERVAAAKSYMFDREYFLSLREALGEHLHLWVVEIEGEIAAASLFTEFNGIVQYHLSGTRTEFLKAYPTKLLLHEVRLWAKQRGNRIMHLGGGVGSAQDSLFAFKAGFSKQTRPFYTWRLVMNPQAYDDLAASRGIDRTGSEEAGFFPSYRRP